MQLCVSPPAACHTLPPSTFRPCTTWIVHRIGAPEESAYVGTIGAESGESALAVARKLHPDGGSSFHVEAQAEVRAHQAALEALVNWDPVPYAFNEAGHAIMAWSFGWQVDCVSIRPKRHWRNCRFERDAVSMGRTIFCDSSGRTDAGAMALTAPRRSPPHYTLL